MKSVPRFTAASILLVAVPLATPGTTAMGAPPSTTTPTPASPSNSADRQLTMTPSATDVLLAPWFGRNGGVPPFNEVRVDAFESAFDAAIEQAAAEVNAIADNPDPPTFENTLVALDNAGMTLHRLEVLFDVHAGNLNVGPVPDLERAITPKLAAHADSITQNQALFERMQAVHDQVQSGAVTLPDDARRLVQETYKTFVRMGAKLDADEKAKLSQINTRLARLFTDFSQNVLEEEKGHVTWIDDETRLAGLPDSTMDAMRAAAIEKGGRAAMAITNTRSSMAPFLTYADDRTLRETVWRNYYFRCDNDDSLDNKSIIREILRLRTARAKLLGYPSHAHWRMESTMAADPAKAMDLMMRVWKPAVARVAEEVADMQAIADAEMDAAGQPRFQIEPWDYRYYAEKVRVAKYDLDMGEVRPYLQLDKLIEAMMWCAGEMFDLHFQPIDDVPVFHPDVTVYEVTNGDGAHVGLFYLDPFARDGKRSGAWMMDYRGQANWTGTAPGVPPATPIVSNNSNFVPAGEGKPVLISWDDAVTLFHEFGHALHGLSSRVNYQSQSGTNVARDFVEFPSQLLEHWLPTPNVLSRFAVHHETGQPMPPELLAKIQRASKFNSGFGTIEFLACAILDMQLHQLGDSDIDIATFEKTALAELGMPAEIPMRHRLPHFSHLFSSDAYSAGYYSYLWSDALTADAAELFEQAPGGYDDDATCQKLFDHIFSVGNTIDPAETYRHFRGRDVDTSALLRKRGFE